MSEQKLATQSSPCAPSDQSCNTLFESNLLLAKSIDLPYLCYFYSGPLHLPHVIQANLEGSRSSTLLQRQSSFCFQHLALSIAFQPDLDPCFHMGSLKLVLMVCGEFAANAQQGPSLQRFAQCVSCSAHCDGLQRLGGSLQKAVWAFRAGWRKILSSIAFAEHISEMLDNFLIKFARCSNSHRSNATQQQKQPGQRRLSKQDTAGFQ